MVRKSGPNVRGRKPRGPLATKRSGKSGSPSRSGRRRAAAAAPRKPRKGDARLTPAGEAFLDASEEIIELYRQYKRDKLAKISRGSNPFDGPLGEFKRRAYSFLRPYIHTSGGHKTISNVLDHLAISERRRSRDQNPFYLGLLALDEYRDLSSSDLSRFAKQMLYADSNDVPACFLVGFVYQVGGPTKIAQRLKANFKEPWTDEERKASFARTKDRDSW